MKSFIVPLVLVVNIVTLSYTNVYASDTQNQPTTAQAYVNKMFTTVKTKSTAQQIQFLKDALIKHNGKQPIHKQASVKDEAIKNAFMSKIEALQKKLPSTYPGCDTQDSIVGRQVWAACNVGASVAGTSEDSIGMYYPYGSYIDHTQVDFSDYKRKAGSWKEGDQGVCAEGYHIPSLPDFQELFRSYDRKKDKEAADLLLAKLQFPPTGYFSSNNLYNTQDTAEFWTATAGSTKYKYSIRVNNEGWGYGNISKSTVPGAKDTSLNIRCIKN